MVVRRRDDDEPGRGATSCTLGSLGDESVKSKMARSSLLTFGDTANASIDSVLLAGFAFADSALASLTVPPAVDLRFAAVLDTAS
jgi:hypothetical protein